MLGRKRAVGTFLAFIVCLSLGGVATVWSQISFSDGEFVRGQDGSLWVVRDGVRYTIRFTDDDGSVAEFPDGGEIGSIYEVVPANQVSSAPAPEPTPRPAPVPTQPPAPPPAPVNPAAALLRQRVSNLCSIISQSRFTAVIERADWSQSVLGAQSSGYFVVVVAAVTNDGQTPDDPFMIAVLVDQRGRRFESLSSTSFPPYFDLTRQFGVRSHVTDIQPGLTQRILWVYEVPADVTSLRIVSDRPTCR